MASGKSRGGAVAWLLAAGFVLVTAVNLPGHLSYDSIMQLNEGRRGFYANWHPPMMSWLLGVFDWIVPGAALFVVFDVGLLFASMGAVLWLNLRGREKPRAVWVPFAVLVFCLFTPQFLLYQGIVWKDVLFADLAIAGFAALAVAGERWEDIRWRIGGGALAFLLLSVAALVRQNGVVALAAGIAALVWLAWKSGPSHQLRNAVAYGLCGLVGSAVVLVAIHSALALRIPGNPSPIVQLRFLQFYDLIGALKTDPSLKTPYLDDDDTELEDLMRTDGVRLYSPVRNDTLAQSERLQHAYFDSPDETLPEEWNNLVLNHPGLYLRVRAEVFRWVFLTPDLPLCRPIFSGVGGPDAQLKKLGLTKRFDARDAALDSYARQFVGTPLFSHAFFAVAGLVLLVPLFLRGRASDIAIAFMLLGSFGFAASFFVISIACDYRYFYYLDLATLVAAFHLSLDWRSAWATVRRIVQPGFIRTA